jgi:hypothetical protein
MLTPRLATEARMANAAASLEPPRCRILLAEDKLVNQKVARKLLEKLHFRVDMAANGKEAVEMWEKSPYNLILMDCQMLEMDGLEATQAIGAREDEDKRPRIPDHRYDCQRHARRPGALSAGWHGRLSFKTRQEYRPSERSGSLGWAYPCSRCRIVVNRSGLLTMI